MPMLGGGVCEEHRTTPNRQQPHRYCCARDAAVATAAATARHIFIYIYKFVSQTGGRTRNSANSTGTGTGTTTSSSSSTQREKFSFSAGWAWWAGKVCCCSRSARARAQLPNMVNKNFVRYSPIQRGRSSDPPARPHAVHFHTVALMVAGSPKSYARAFATHFGDDAWPSERELFAPGPALISLS